MVDIISDTTPGTGSCLILYSLVIFAGMVTSRAGIQYSEVRT